MKLLKRMAVLSLCALVLSGCTKSSIPAQAPAAQESVEGLDQMDPEKLAALEEEFIPKIEMVEDEEYEETMFDWEQVSDEAADLFEDTAFYPESVKMDYAADEEAASIELTWVLANGTPEDVANTAAFLASDSAAFITGQIIGVNGGFVI